MWKLITFEIFLYSESSVLDLSFVIQIPTGTFVKGDTFLTF